MIEPHSTMASHVLEKRRHFQLMGLPVRQTPICYSYYTTYFILVLSPDLFPGYILVY